LMETTTDYGKFELMAEWCLKEERVVW
jgi:hypothetical protein